jgi:Mce-associated membrane protein
LVLVTIGLIVAVTVLGIRVHDNHEVQAAKNGALAAATVNVPKILSYRADSAGSELGSAADLLTGDFKNRFRTLVDGTIVPAARQHQTATTATVAGKSVVSGTADAVTVLLFIDQSTTSKESPQPRLDASRVRIHMDRVGDRWLISGLEPV